VGPQSRPLDSPGLVPGAASVPAQPGPGEPAAGTDGLAFRVRPPRRPEPGSIAAHDAVILSAGDLKIAQEAVALARQDSENDKRLAEAGPPGPPPPAAQPPEPPPAPEPPPEPEPPPAGPAAQDLQAPGSQPASPPQAAQRPTPSWGTVLATTVRLWAQRRLRGPRRLWPDSRRWRVISVVILAAVLFCGGAITVALARGPAGRQPAGHQPPAGGGTSASALAAAAAARTAAATWAAHQVAPAAIIACDPQMCSVLQRHGITASRLLVLGPGSAAPLGSDVIVSTAAVRQAFGARLSSVYAPVALASFGAGSAQAVIRVVAPDGGAAYLRALRTDVAARAAGGAQLLRNPRIHATPAARQALAAGQVDSRLLSAFAALATIYRLNVAGFGPAATGAAPGMPLRTAEIAPGPRITRQHPATLSALASFLRAQLPPYRPARVTTLRLASGQTVLHVEYGAPEPLGLLGKS
jgi:hypothetical protein